MAPRTTLGSRSRGGRLVAVALAVGLGSGCTCGRRDPPDGERPSAAPREAQAAPPASAPDVPRVSAPIGAALAPDGAVIVAGLSVPEKAVRVTRLERDGRVGWTTVALTGFEWVHDAEVGVHVVAEGIVLAVRGRVDGAPGRWIVPMTADGVARPKAPFGAVSCATREAVLWLEGRSKLHVERGSGPKILAVPAGGDPSLFCGAGGAAIVLDAEGAISTAPVGPSAVGVPTPLLVDGEHSGDEREHALFATAAGPGALRVGEDGALVVKVPGQADRRPTERLGEDDDLVIVDADARTLYAIYTRDHEGCAEGEDAAALPTQRTSRFSISVHALRIDLASGQATREDLGRGPCGHHVGPFFVGLAGGKHVLSWVERAPTGGDRRRASIVGVARRALGAGGAARREPLSADAVVDAGCTQSECALVYLERPRGEDDKKPEAPRVLRYGAD